MLIIYIIFKLQILENYLFEFFLIYLFLNSFEIFIKYYNTIFYFYIKFYTIFILNLIIKFNITSQIFKLNNTFFKEGLYVDLLQKLSFDYWIKIFLYTTTVLFNSNYLNNFIIKFIINSLLNYVTGILIQTDNLNLYQILYNVLITFFIIYNILFLIIINYLILI